MRPGARLPRILIAGGTGFIGRHLVKRAVERGWKPVVLSLHPPAKGRVVPGATYLQADLARSGPLFPHARRGCFDYVVNCGGYVDHRPFGAGGEEVWAAHFRGTVRLAEWVGRSSLRRFVQLGSSDEYGDLPAPQREDMREAPIAPYSLGKLAATHYLQMRHRLEGFPAVILRLFLCYGPGQGGERLVPHVIQSCLARKKFPVTSGIQRRDFSHVDDVVEAVMRALVRPHVCGEVINVGSGRPVRLRDLIRKIRQAAGGGHPVFGARPLRPGEPRALFADVRKARQLLGWRPRLTLQEGIRRTLIGYRNSDGR